MSKGQSSHVYHCSPAITHSFISKYLLCAHHGRQRHSIKISKPRCLIWFQNVFRTLYVPMFVSHPFQSLSPWEYLPIGDLEHALNLPGFPFVTYKEGSVSQHCCEASMIPSMEVYKVWHNMQSCLLMLLTIMCPVPYFPRFIQLYLQKSRDFSKESHANLCTTVCVLCPIWLSKYQNRYRKYCFHN